MTDSAGAVAGKALPLRDDSRGRRLLKILAWLVGIVVVVGILELLGVDVTGWFSDLWDQIKAVPVQYIIVGLAFQSAQTFFAGLSYYGILSAAYPGEVLLAPIVTAYAVGVAMNNFLPANIGTFVTLLMFVALIPKCNVGGSIAAYLVQKIFFVVAGAAVYLYLFLSVPGSFDLNLGNFSEHPGWSIIIGVGGAFLIVLVGRIFWRQVKKLWAQAKQGGVILSHPKRYFGRVFLPSFLSYACKFAVIGIFLAAFAIPVTFESITWVVGSRLARQRRVVHTGCSRRHAGDQCARAGRLLPRPEEHGDRVLDRATAHHDCLECHLRDDPGRDRLRLDGRQAARLELLRRREATGRRKEGGAQAEARGAEGGRHGGR